MAVFVRLSTVAAWPLRGPLGKSVFGGMLSVLGRAPSTGVVEGKAR